jgi:hypothetical protein
MDETQVQTQENDIVVDVNQYIQRERAVAKLKKSGIRFPAQPGIPDEWQDDDGMFQMPQDLTMVDSHELGRLMTLINNMLAWYGAILASARIDRLSAERTKNYTEAKVRMEIMSNKEMLKDYKAREDKDAYINTHPIVRQAQDWFDRQASLEIMAEQLYNDLDRSIRTVSREVSRRGGEMNHFNREQNLK